MKTIKVIDILNKIINGEEIPTIEYKGMRTICYYLFDKCGEQCDDRELKNILNYEIEILEENKTPEKIVYGVNLDGDAFIYANHRNNFLDGADVIVVDKINEIIDYLEIKEKGE